MLTYRQINLSDRCSQGLLKHWNIVIIMHDRKARWLIQKHTLCHAVSIVIPSKKKKHSSESSFNNDTLFLKYDFFSFSKKLQVIQSPPLAAWVIELKLPSYILPWVIPSAVVFAVCLSSRRAHLSCTAVHMLQVSLSDSERALLFQGPIQSFLRE